MSINEKNKKQSMYDKLSTKIKIYSLSAPSMVKIFSRWFYQPVAA